jgi:hypothetical protein
VCIFITCTDTCIAHFLTSLTVYLIAAPSLSWCSSISSSNLCFCLLPSGFAPYPALPQGLSNFFNKPFDVRLYICIYRPHQLDAATTMLTISSMESFWFASPIAMSDLRSQPPSGGFLPTLEHVELFQHAVWTHGDYIYHLPTSRLRETFLDAYTNTPVRESNRRSRLVPFDLPAQGFLPTLPYLRACRTFPTLLSDLR